MPNFGRMWSWYRRRWLDLVASIYIYNEHRGYTALDEVLAGLRGANPRDDALIAEVEQHRADEHKHYLMFKRWFEKRGQKPLLVDRACGHIDRFIEIMFRRPINDLDTPAMVRDPRHFERLCRVIALTERRGYRQLDILLRHPVIREERQLTKIYEIIREDEPRHWAPYEGWLKRNAKREPAWWERLIDSFIHSELLLLKLPVLFLTPNLSRRTDWPDEADPVPLTVSRAVAAHQPQPATKAAAKVIAAATLITSTAAELMSLAAPMSGS